MIIISLIVVIISLLYAYIHLSKKSRQIDRMFPGPYRTPFIGTLLIKSSKIQESFATKYGYRPYRLWFLNKPFIIIPDHKTAKIILSQSKFNDKADVYEAFVPLLGRNHFVGTGDVWAKHRKHASTAFHYKVMGYYLKIFSRNCDTLCKTLKRHVGEGPINIEKYISLHVMDNLSESLSGTQMHMQLETDRNRVDIEAFINVSKIFNWRVMIPILGFDWIFNLTSLSKTQKQSIKIIRDLMSKILHDKKESLDKQPKLQNSNKTENEEELLAQDALTYFIKCNEFTEEEIQREMESALLAGFESVKNTICFALYSLAKYQDIQDKVYNELKTVTGELDNWQNLNKLVYLEQVLNETLRCHSPFRLIGRRVKEDLYLNEHQFIPKDTNVSISLTAIHKDPTIWPNPHIFDPDRFSPENSQNRDPYTFVAFSAGPRKCSGYKFGMVEMKVTVARILQLFKLSPSSNPEDKLRPTRNAGLTITSNNGFHVKLEPRDETGNAQKIMSRRIRTVGF